MNAQKMLKLSKEVDALTAKYPIGTPIRYWPGVREGEGRLSKTRSNWLVDQNGIIAVFVEGYAGYIAKSHVEPVEETK